MHELHELTYTIDPSEQEEAHDFPPETNLNFSRDNFFRFFIMYDLLINRNKDTILFSKFSIKGLIGLIF